jgi:uncharacterized protein (TIGR00251 family)
MSAEFLREEEGGCLLFVKAQPRAGRTAIDVVQGSELKIRLAAPPVDDAANEALVRFLAEELGLPRGAVQLLRGSTSRHKVVFLRGLNPAEARERLGVA